MQDEIIEKEKATPEWWTVAIPLDFKPLLENVADAFGYKPSDAARNTMRVGSRLALENPAEFLRLLNGNG